VSASQDEGTTLRIVIADDERPARSFLANLLRGCPDVALVGEASGGADAVALIERLQPDLALLDLQMPEVDGLDVVRLLHRDRMPLVAFVTAHDEYAVRAFELNAIDYLLKPVDGPRLRRTLTRAHDRLERADLLADARASQSAALSAIEQSREREPVALRRIPVRRRDDIVLLAVDQIVSIVADGELLHLRTATNERYTITHRLKNLEARLDGDEFVRLSRGALVRVSAIQKVSPMPGGTYLITMSNGQQLSVSRLRAKALREQLLKL
jgi:two-component system LytT family response regulator